MQGEWAEHRPIPEQPHRLVDRYILVCVWGVAVIFRKSHFPGVEITIVCSQRHRNC